MLIFEIQKFQKFDYFMSGGNLMVFEIWEIFEFFFF